MKKLVLLIIVIGFSINCARRMCIDGVAYNVDIFAFNSSLLGTGRVIITNSGTALKCNKGENNEQRK